jgi:ribosome-associated toxin RatA of RatAB toxin-antitoxin module
VELTADLDAPCSPDELFAWVDDLDRYPSWLGIVTRAEPAGDEPHTWIVDLRARVGPFARAKRLTMRRVEHQHPHLAVFERDERDGKQHGVWVLRAEVSPSDSGSTLAMTLRYDGRWWAAPLQGVLAEEIERSRARLLELVST